MTTIAFDNSYAALPGRFYARQMPTPVAAPKLIKLNVPLARELGLDPDWLASEEGVAMLAGNRVPDGADPIAMVYAGHQFGNFVPQLGDGRALLLGEVIDQKGVRRDIHLKGAGPTLYSRRGDGRAALGPVLREYIVSEAMHALGIPTTRALAAVSSGEGVWRELPLPGAVFTRVAQSHVRVGTFQYFAAQGDMEAVRTLADYVIARHYADAHDAANPYRALLDGVIAAQADLVARWLLVGFIHGVMNTDNTSIVGETIDYGPCAFMDAYHPDKVFSSIDAGGRYAYGNQPSIAIWNLARFAETLLPLLDEDEKAAIGEAEAALAKFGPAFQRTYGKGLCAKLGLREARDDDVELTRDLFSAMAEGEADFTLTFRALCNAALGHDGDLLAHFSEKTAIEIWLKRWRDRLAKEGGDAQACATMMRRANPAYIPRNHRIEEVIAAALEHGDFAPFETLLTVLARPYDDQPEFAEYRNAPRPDEIVNQTFCGT
jgi:uncharacterized protein YdiU (UPF0061 family)